MIRIANTDQEIFQCFPAMKQLRTHLNDSTFVATIRKQQQGGYQLVFLEDDSRVVAAAGFRVLDKLDVGRSLYVDDLVTDTTQRSSGHGKRLFDWLVQRARAENCVGMELDCGVQRFDAHRFYLTNRMFISSHHLALKV